MKPIATLPLVAAAMAIAGIVPAWADPPRLKPVEEKAPILFAEGAKGTPALLKTVKVRYETPPTKVGELQKGWLCSPAGDIVWNAKLFDIFSPYLRKTFRTELEKARYPVPRVSDAIFDEKKEKTPGSELHVGALVKEISATFCTKGSDGALGGVHMKLFWQAFSPESQKVVFEATTEGSFQTETAEKIPAGEFFARAFAMATRNLLAEQGFHDAVAGVPAPAEAAAPSQERLRLKGVRPGDEPLASAITNVRAAVATVFGEVGSGTGFFVSPDGYLLTNQHVVGATRFVKVRLPTGRELVGEVVRSDRSRDVALVKAEPPGVKPLPLRSGEPNVGDEVYAIGSPLGDKFSGTLTRGVLSGYRTLDDKRFLQSDVAILPGSSGGPLLDGKGAVVGITTMGLGARGMAGMNFFIPIADALAKLGVDAE